MILLPIIHAEPIFEKDYKTTHSPETKIIRYRVLNPNKETKSYAFSFTGKIIRGQVIIQIEDTQKNIIERKEIPAFSLLHWNFILPQEIALDNIYISLHLKNTVGNIYSIVTPTVQTQQIFLTQSAIVSLALLLISLCSYIIWKKSLPFSWLLWGITLGICAKILFYIVDYVDSLPTTLLVDSSTQGEDLSDYIFSTYISLRETALLFLLLGIFSKGFLSQKQVRKTVVSISMGITSVFLIGIVVEGLLATFLFTPQLKVSPYSLALLSVIASHTQLYFLLTPFQNILLSGLWFSSFYLVLSGTINADKRTVLHGILIFIVTEAILVYFENSYFIYKYSSWWAVVLLIVISFFPVFLLKFRSLVYPE